MGVKVVVVRLILYQIFCLFFVDKVHSIKKLVWMQRSTRRRKLDKVCKSWARTQSGKSLITFSLFIIGWLCVTKPLKLQCIGAHKISNRNWIISSPLTPPTEGANPDVCLWCWKRTSLRRNWAKLQWDKNTHKPKIKNISFKSSIACGRVFPLLGIW